MTTSEPGVMFRLGSVVFFCECGEEMEHDLEEADKREQCAGCGREYQFSIVNDGWYAEVRDSTGELIAQGDY